ncbi:DUF2244 domain-containing protein [Duganella sp. FT80W]|uniref:DUF2244 domain-containing protein n=1 Tax=Duganella guangzhouensis TaxID=2666084 RepID=A0A6I2L435_9BURK|nr:DUF2244 domain-containing protein [Duganella guangzhouensis]MRW91614.1 DUF2244 domain-containing protein [Duganella guangzhouensis]
MPRDVPSERRSWLLRRRSVMSRRQLKLLFAALCVPSLLIAASFLWWGYWYILAYSVLELSVIALCLRHHARHSGDYDRIDISPAVIIIKQRRARNRRRVLLNPCTTRLQAPARERDPLVLSDLETRITLAEFLPAAQRRQLALDLVHHVQQFKDTGDLYGSRSAP